MPRLGNTPFAFPDFRGATRKLILANLCAFLALAIAQLVSANYYLQLSTKCSFIPRLFMDGYLWQPLTYSFVHPSLTGTLFELLSLWFLAGFLEGMHSSDWVLGLYASAVLGTAASALAMSMAFSALHVPLAQAALTGCVGGIFGLLVAIGVLYGDTQFMLFFTIGIKARYLVAIYALIAIVSLLGAQRMYAFAQLGGGLIGWLYIRCMPRRGMRYLFSERWYGMRNRFYKWKRRRAARKFEVYMRSQGRTVRLDGNGNPLDEDSDDKKRWN